MSAEREYIDVNWSTCGNKERGVIAHIAPTPLLIIHGTNDTVVPYSHGKRLYEPAPKRLWTVEGEEHTEAFADPGSEYRQRLVAFFNEALEGKVMAGEKQSSSNAAVGKPAERSVK